MFEIGFWEIVLIGVVALVVVGPKDLPVLMRTVGTWVSRARAITGEFKDEFNREVARAEELKKLVEREVELAEMHKAIEDARKTVARDGGNPRQRIDGPQQDADRAHDTGDAAMEQGAGGVDDERSTR